MKNLILLVGFCIGLVACTSSVQKIKDDDINLVKSYVKAVEELDFDAMEEFLDDSYIGMGPSYGDTIRKIEAIENWKANVTYLYEKIHYNRSKFAVVTIPEGKSKEYWVANWAELNIIYKNDLGSVTIWANTDYLVKNGKIVKSLTFYNEADALRQLGYIFVPADVDDQVPDDNTE